MKTLPLILATLLLPISFLIAQPSVPVNIVSWGGIGEDYFLSGSFTQNGEVRVAGVRNSNKLIMIRYSSTLTRQGVHYFASPSSSDAEFRGVKYAFDEEGNLAFALEFDGAYRFYGRTIGSQSDHGNMAFGIINSDGTLRWVASISKRQYQERQAEGLVYQDGNLYLSLAYSDHGIIVSDSLKIVFDENGRYRTESS